MKNTVRTRHTVSGVIDENTPRHIFEHAVLGKYLEEVGPNAKPYLPEMHRTSLPAKPSDDQIAVAIAAGVIDEDEAAALREDAVVETEDSTKELEAKRVALQTEAEKKGKK